MRPSVAGLLTTACPRGTRCTGRLPLSAGTAPPTPPLVRFLPTRIHGLLDYLTGLLFLAAPWLFGFAGETDDIATWLFVVLGAGVLLYSLFTDYELGLVRKLPMPVHLTLDLGGGILLLVSPWLFGFADEVWVPHVLFGLLEVSAALVTQRPSDVRSVGVRRPGLA